MGIHWENVLYCRGWMNRIDNVQYYASSMGLPRLLSPLAQHWMSVTEQVLLFLPHLASTSEEDDSLLLTDFDLENLMRVSYVYNEQKKLSVSPPLSNIKGFKLLFSYSIPSIKCSEFAPPVLPSWWWMAWDLFTLRNIDTVWRKSGSRFNEEYASREAERAPRLMLLQNVFYWGL